MTGANPQSGFDYNQIAKGKFVLYFPFSIIFLLKVTLTFRVRRVSYEQV